MYYPAVIRLMGEHKARYFVVVVCACLVTCCEAAIHPLLMKSIFDAVSAKKSFSDFIWLGIAYFALGLIVNVASHYMSLWKMRVDNAILAGVSQDLLSSFYGKDYADVIQLGDGHYISRIHSDVRDGLVPMLIALRSIIVSIASFIVLIIVLLYLSWQAFAVLAVVIPVSAIVSITVSKRIKSLTDLERDLEANLVDVLSRSIRAYKMVKCFSLLPTTLHTYRSSLDATQTAAYNKLKTVRSLQTAGDLTMVVSDSSSVLVGAYLVFNSMMTLGSFIAFMNSFWRAATTLVSIFNMWADMHGYNATVHRIAKFGSGDVRAPNVSLGSCVNLSLVQYQYGENSVLSNLSLNIGKHDRIAIKGANGSGKTTLANIMAGYLTPSSGEAVLPGRISASTLPVHFPPALVRDLPICPTLLKRFGLDIPTILNSRPDLLSAGQQQKVALALTLTKPADLYILDEPLANLDADARTVALEEIRSRTHGKSLVLIMHEVECNGNLFDRIIDLSKSPIET